LKPQLGTQSGTLYHWLVKMTHGHLYKNN
jgi:hypothetical protein